MAGLGRPRLFLPSPADVHRIDVMPLIGIGKVDLEQITPALTISALRARA